MGHTPWLKSFSPETEKEEDHVRTTGASEVTVTHSGKMGITEQHWGAQAHGAWGREEAKGETGLRGARVWVLLPDSVAGVVSGGRDTQKNGQWPSKLSSRTVDFLTVAEGCDRP